MTNPEVALLMLSLFIVMVLLGFPVAFTLLAMGVGFGYYAYYEAGSIETVADVFNNKIFYLLNQNTYSVMENDTLVAIPLFLFMGYVVERANIVNKLFYALQMAARNLPGSMAISALITCAVFSTASGIVGAVVTLMGLLAYPAMAKANYDKSFASGVICAGGTLGILIPPSIMLIVYAAIAELSPLRLYAAAVIPGFLLAGLYIVYVVVRVFINPSIAPKPRDEDVPPARVVYWQLLTSFVPLTALIMLVLGSILGGLATPAEAAAMGALGGLVLASGYRIGAIRTGEVTPEWVVDGKIRVNDWWFSIGYGGVLAAAAFGAYFLARVVANEIFGMPLPEELALPIGPGVGIALVAILTLITRYLSATFAATIAVLGPVIFFTILEVLGLFGLTPPIDYGILLAICFALAVVPALSQRPGWALTAIGIGAYGPLSYVALKLLVVLLGGAGWVFGTMSLELPGVLAGQLRLLISDNSGVIFVALTVLALGHLFFHHRKSAAVHLFRLLAPEQDVVRKLIEFGGVAGVVGMGLNAVFLFMFAVLDLSGQFTFHPFIYWMFEVGFFVCLFGYMGWKGIQKKDLKGSVYLTAKATAMVCWLFVGSWTFASVFSYLGGHEIIEHFVLGLNLAPWEFLVLVQVIIFVLGWPLEWSEILIIFVPIFLPMLSTFGVNPYFFAMLVALNLQTSFLTPPMAMSAYYLKGVLGNAIELIDIFKGIMPYLGIVIFVMIMMYQFPGIALWLPDQLFGTYVP